MIRDEAEAVINEIIEKSGLLPASKRRQERHSLHAFAPFMQSIDFASALAKVRLPSPSSPSKRIAWGIRPLTNIP